MLLGFLKCVLSDFSKNSIKMISCLFNAFLVTSVVLWFNVIFIAWNQFSNSFPYGFVLTSIKSNVIML